MNQQPKSLESILTQATADTNGGVRFTKSIQPLPLPVSPTTGAIAALLQQRGGHYPVRLEIREQGAIVGALVIDSLQDCSVIIHGEPRVTVTGTLEGCVHWIAAWKRGREDTTPEITQG